ncbi:Hypothetical protein NCS54_00174900 [Fusarium falciforme]|uniref:Hypothetical protein n=1 Tax=Fusarium falciforme TaxID=195108 RepID=UPI0023000D2B|nr:Hypothetical protein NCS54_00174900 [Fusarium falciforme]WAO84532.1 Hypothetical protein NCS54_00174900 [Fusarium falciforme]
MSHRDGDAFDRVHPDFVDLMFRVGIDPPINPSSEDAMARSIYLAIQMADADEQAELMSRIVPEEELAAERLKEGDFRNLDHRITLDEVERLAALRATPEPNRQVDRRGGYLGECIICGVLPAEQSSVSFVVSVGRRATANYTEDIITWCLCDAGLAESRTGTVELHEMWKLSNLA